MSPICPLDTLEKVVTQDQAKENLDEGNILCGRGSDKETVYKWTEKKYKSMHIADALMEVAFQAEDWKWYHRYRYTKEKCLDRFTTGEGRAYGHYCKKPWCPPICLAIRKATHMNQYFPIISQWEKPVFLTLTAQSHSHKELGVWLEYLNSKLNRILDKFKMRNLREGKGETFKCLICLECCYNPVARTYNPHFHNVTSNYGESRDLRTEWIMAFPRVQVQPVAQFMIVVKDKEENLKEVIKYGRSLLQKAYDQTQGFRYSQIQER